MDVGLNYMDSGYEFRTKLPETELESKKKEMLAAVGETLVTYAGISIEKSKGRDVDVVPEGEECLCISTSVYSERWTKDHLRRTAEKIRYLSGAEVTVALNRPGVCVNGNMLYDDFCEETKPPTYLFFDIDGVLNKESMWKTNYSLDNQMIDNLGCLCFKLNAELILMSSWRTGFRYSFSDENAEPIRMLENRLWDKHCKKILGKTDILKGRKREAEIERYRMLHDETLNYVVLDDDPGEYGEINERMYFTNPKKGLTKDDVEQMSKRYDGIIWR